MELRDLAAAHLKLAKGQVSVVENRRPSLQDPSDKNGAFIELLSFDSTAQQRKALRDAIEQNPFWTKRSALDREAYLQEVFETTFSFDLESLHKKGLKQAAKQIARHQAANDYSVNWVLQNSLDAHSIPVDEPTLRVLRRLALVDSDQEDPEAMGASLEHFVPKTKCNLFGELLSMLADEYCHEDEPNCGDCPLASECPTASENVRSVLPGKTSRLKSR